MKEWYFSINGRQTGPVDLNEAKVIVRENPGAYAWKSGMQDWQPVFELPDIRRMKKDGVTPFPAPPPNMMSPKPSTLPQGAQQQQSTLQSTHQSTKSPSLETSSRSTGNQNINSGAASQQASSGFGSDQYTEGLDFKIYGNEMQFVEVELDPQESTVAEAGAMMYKTADVEMETIFGDGSSSSGGSGFLGTLMGAGRRLLTGESLFTTIFSQQGAGKGRVAFAAPFPGTIMALKLSDYNGKLICQKDSFLAGAKGVSIGLHFQKRILTGLFGGEGFILQKLEGEGWVFVHMGGAIRKVELSPGETLHVDTGCIAAMTQDVDFDIQAAGGIKTMLFGGEGFFFATLRGPGTVWLQSLPFSRLAGRMLSAAPGAGGQRQGEGSLLGGLGDFIGGR